MTKLLDFAEGSFWPGIEGGGERRPVGLPRVVREGLREIAACALEPLFPAGVPASRGRA